MSTAYIMHGEVENKYRNLNGQPEERDFFLGCPTEGKTYYLLFVVDIIED